MERILTRSILAAGVMLAHTTTQGQGCVAIRSFTACNPNVFTNSSLLGKGWQLSMNYRYFESNKHYRGTDYQEERIEKGTEVINWANQVNIGLTYNFNKRQGITFVLPWVYNTRSSLYEHGFTERHSMRSSGLSDIRISYNYWLFDPDSAHHGNLAVGAGIKLPTGNFDYRAFWYNVGPDIDGDSVPDGEYRPVDQSIQPGDGGLGFTIELQGFAKLAGPLSGYVNGFYLLNPMNSNGTRTYRETISPTLWNETICGVPDQFMARAGLNLNFNQRLGLNVFCGGRIEGIPVEDLIGSSDSFRRPGYVISLEPGIDWMRGRHDVNFSVPIAMYRNRTQSVTDKERSELTGTFVNGDAAFADYLINISWSIRLGGGSLL